LALVAFAFVVASSFAYISAKKHEILPKKYQRIVFFCLIFLLKFSFTNEISSSGWIILAVPAAGSIFNLLPDDEPGLVVDIFDMPDAVVVILEEELISLFV